MTFVCACGQSTVTGLTRCVGCEKQHNREYYAANKGRINRNRIRRKHLSLGLAPDDWERMLKAQNGCCKICSSELRGYKNTHLDHCHSTGKIRGLLCRECNVAIGIFRDDPERLRAAAKYLEESRQ